MLSPSLHPEKEPLREQQQRPIAYLIKYSCSERTLSWNTPTASGPPHAIPLPHAGASPLLKPFYSLKLTLKTKPP